MSIVAGVAGVAGVEGVAEEVEGIESVVAEETAAAGVSGSANGGRRISSRLVKRNIKFPVSSCRSHLAVAPGTQAPLKLPIKYRTYQVAGH